jgi:O-antigen/teichoic acid export membrane protein
MSIDAPAAGAGHDDLSGRSRLLHNVFSSWLSQLVFMGLGFIMPRLVDHQVGQAALGVWDFCWSLVSYLTISGLYVGTSVNRYVARLRGEQNARELNRIIASVVCIQIVAAVIIILCTISIVWMLPRVFADRLGDDVDSAMWIVAFLGVGIAVQMLFDSARGIITGCHRWDIYNALNVGSQAIASVGMIIAVVSGSGLEGMVVVYFAVVCITEYLRLRVSRRVCPEIRLDLRLATRGLAKDMLRFGLKSIVIHTPNLLATQTANVAVLTVMGPAALAVFARPLALIRHTGTFVDKFAAVLTPTASFLQSTASKSELKEFLLISTRFSVALTLPVLLILAANGDWIMRLWMGARYVDHALIAVLALLSFLTISQSSVTHVLVGLNAHGRIGGTALVVTLVGLAAGILTANLYGWTLLSAAILLMAPLTLSKGVIMPWMSCRRLGVSVAEYVRFCFAKALAIGAVLAACLWLGRLVSSPYEWLGIIVSICIGSFWTIYAYWRYLLEPEHRERLRERLRRKRSAPA